MIRRMLLKVAQRRAPDVVIGGHADPYLLRWWLLPRNPVFNVYLHCFKRSDDDRALHDHPWLFNLSWLLHGQYREWVLPPKRDPLMLRLWPKSMDTALLARWYRLTGLLPDDYTANGDTHTAWAYGRHEGAVKFRWGRAPHRIELTDGDCWTLFITGPRIREWGFYCPKGWRHWKEFTAPHDAGQTGRGCE